MEMPKPNQHHSKLEVLAGKWKAKEKIHPTPWDPRGGDAEGEFLGRVDLDGFCIVADYVQKREGKVCYRGHGVYGWDNARQKYTMYWFDTMAGAPVCPPAEGTWEGDTLSFVSVGDTGHGRYTYRFKTPKQIYFSIENSQNGKDWDLFLEGDITKV